MDPELRTAAFSFHMDMGWFSPVGRIKEKAIGSYSENRRHPDKLLDWPL